MEIVMQFAQQNALLLSTLILILAYIFIAAEKIPKVTIALIGATITLLLGLLNQTPKTNNLFNNDYFINYIDWNVIFLLVSMMIIVNIATRSGIFNWIANEMLKKTKGHPKTIFICLAIFTAVTSAFLDNVTTVILILPITLLIAKELDINPIPFLVIEILSSNIGGTATLIGDPPNIIIGSAANLSFLDFIYELTAIVAIIMFIVIVVMMFIFRKYLKTTEEKMDKIARLDNSDSIKDKNLMLRSLF